MILPSPKLFQFPNSDAHLLRDEVQDARNLLSDGPELIALQAPRAEGLAQLQKR